MKDNDREFQDSLCILNRTIEDQFEEEIRNNTATQSALNYHGTRFAKKHGWPGMRLTLVGESRDVGIKITKRPGKDWEVGSYIDLFCHDLRFEESDEWVAKETARVPQLITMISRIGNQFIKDPDNRDAKIYFESLERI